MNECAAQTQGGVGLCPIRGRSPNRWPRPVPNSKGHAAAGQRECVGVSKKCPVDALAVTQACKAPFAVGPSKISRKAGDYVGREVASLMCQVAARRHVRVFERVSQ